MLRSSNAAIGSGDGRKNKNGGLRIEDEDLRAWAILAGVLRVGFGGHFWDREVVCGCAVSVWARGLASWEAALMD